ncbi:MAG: GSCFA domain-containing protein [Bacteroidaceae bacterium]|nr:GSCFA domain-containing protein [Bacteroidaceae bacterium]
MEFRTKVHIHNKELSLSHRYKYLLLGSCFSDSIGDKLMNAGFDCVANPFGALYNPLSIMNALSMRDDEFYRWTQKSCDDLNFDQVIHTIDVFVLTFGTAWVYELKETGHVVANCKKQPDTLFLRRRITIDEIVEKYAQFIENAVVPNHKIILFTVSPIRHKKDGLHENQLSKSILLLAIDCLCKAYPNNCYYFPSYEIMLDELRDYRFYADDMLHPSQVAVQYIWECFQQTYFSPKTIEFIEQFEHLNRILHHQPLDASNTAHQQLVAQTIEQINQLKHAIQNQ